MNSINKLRLVNEYLGRTEEILVDLDYELGEYGEIENPDERIKELIDIHKEYIESIHDAYRRAEGEL